MQRHDGPIAAIDPCRRLPSVRHALTVDLEDYYQVSALAGSIRRSDWVRYPSRIEANTHRLLDLFDRRHTRATFFVLGYEAERRPALIRTISERGHELACHGYDHRLLTDMDPEMFRGDLRHARSSIEDAAGAGVSGYRAPSYSITRKTLWALDILASEGFAYDSSIFPVHHDRYGISDHPRHLHRLRLSSGRSLIEFPPTTLRSCGVNLPAAGGGYLRQLPWRIFHFALERSASRHGMPGLLYLHPWEIDPDQPRVSANRLTKIRHYRGLAGMERKVDKLLTRLEFAPMGEVIDSSAESIGGS